MVCTCVVCPCVCVAAGSRSTPRSKHGKACQFREAPYVTRTRLAVDGPTSVHTSELSDGRSVVSSLRSASSVNTFGSLAVGHRVTEKAVEAFQRGYSDFGGCGWFVGFKSPLLDLSVSAFSIQRCVCVCVWLWLRARADSVAPSHLARAARWPSRHQRSLSCARRRRRPAGCVAWPEPTSLGRLPLAVRISGAHRSRAAGRAQSSRGHRPCTQRPRGPCVPSPLPVIPRADRTRGRDMP